TEGHFAGDENTLSGQISAHLLIDKTGEWRFMVPLDTVAYAAGNLPVNRASINVEQSGFADGRDGGYTDDQYRCMAAFYRFCVANGMTGVPAVYIGKNARGTTPAVSGILGHQDVPRDDGQPGWGGNYGHTDPGPTYDFARLIGYIGNAQPQPSPDTFFVDGNPKGNIPVKIPFWNRWHLLDTQGLALPTLGYPVAPEQSVNGRRVQEFERGWLGLQDAPEPWNVVTLFPSEWPTPAKATAPKKRATRRG
ncbi:MAG: N-acetylmuramoyl-L-alanine amidase, partial [Thermomicrobia bacterium]|nr:N-acetylmuramoyl-L-alanine amidase [Thermomicrobia bacterium]